MQPITTPPPLHTARLTLRAHDVTDFDALAAMWADPEVMRHIGSPSTLSESWARLLRYRGLWPLLGYGYWAVHETATGRLVGDVGLADFCRDVTPSIRNVPEAGWVLATWAHGKGYAQEAMQTALAWLDAQGHPVSVCLIAPDNTPSLTLADRLGYTTPTPTQLHTQPSIKLTRLAG